MIRSKSIHGSRIHRTILFATLVCLIAGSATVAQAEFVDLIPTGPPDVTTSYTTTDYNASTGVFTAVAYSYGAILDNEHYVYNYDGDGNDLPTFDITMHVDASGTFTSGSLSMMGYFDDDYLNSSDSTLLTAQIAQFGSSYADRTAELEFLFNVTGGALQTACVYPAQVGLLFHDSGFKGDWTQDFSSNQACSDMFNVESSPLPIPEPSGLALLSTLAIGGGLGFGRRTFSRGIRCLTRRFR